jgi:hypothetical protein
LHSILAQWFLIRLSIVIRGAWNAPYLFRCCLPLRRASGGQGQRRGQKGYDYLQGHMPACLINVRLLHLE